MCHAVLISTRNDAIIYETYISTDSLIPLPEILFRAIFPNIKGTGNISVWRAYRDRYDTFVHGCLHTGCALELTLHNGGLHPIPHILESYAPIADFHWRCRDLTLNTHLFITTICTWLEQVFCLRWRHSEMQRGAPWRLASDRKRTRTKKQKNLQLYIAFYRLHIYKVFVPRPKTQGVRF